VRSRPVAENLSFRAVQKPDFRARRDGPLAGCWIRPTAATRTHNGQKHGWAVGQLWRTSTVSW